ncbi:choloylglycine hydrolase, partial [Bacillus anthracis]|nr:choloylglycine hydrolase [Bacillus anthracis]
MTSTSKICHDLKEEGISAVVHILSNCEVPKGGV